jgi:uncharacterized protein
MTAPLQTILSELRTRLQAHYGERLDRLVLYGSQARGDAEPDSDIDVLVVLKGGVEWGREIQAVVPITADLCVRYHAFISCSFVAAHQYRDDLDEPLLINVRREGVLV